MCVSVPWIWACSLPFHTLRCATLCCVTLCELCAAVSAAGALRERAHAQCLLLSVGARVEVVRRYRTLGRGRRRTHLANMLIDCYLKTKISRNIAVAPMRGLLSRGRCRTHSRARTLARPLAGMRKHPCICACAHACTQRMQHNAMQRTGLDGL